MFANGLAVWFCKPTTTLQSNTKLSKAYKLYHLLWAVLYSIIMREQHIDFIRKDLKERGETPTSNITFFGAIYSLKVKKEGDKRAKTVTYSAAQNVLSGYRAILV